MLVLVMRQVIVLVLVSGVVLSLPRGQLEDVEDIPQFDPMPGDTRLRSMEESIQVPRTPGVVRSMVNPKLTNFRIDERYPPGDPNQIPEFILTSGAWMNVNCSSRVEWLDCKWKTPMNLVPCHLYKDDEQKKCDFGDFQIRHHELNGNLHVCSLMGTVDPNLQMEGNFNCDLSSMPDEQNANEYYYDQQYFNLNLVRPPRVQLSYAGRSREKEMFEADTLELTCTAENAFPSPNITWYLNSQPIQFSDDSFSITSTDGPRLRGEENYFLEESIRYVASLQENGRILGCKVTQLDDENNLSEVFNEDLSVSLFVKAIPDPPAIVVTAEMIGGIVLVILALLLVLAIVGFAFYTKRWCFSTPIVTIAATKNKETGEMTIQTDEIKEQKPKSEGVSTETEPLLGKAFETQTDLGDIPPDLSKEKEDDINFSPDQLLEFCYEGNGSVAGSLSSIASSQKSVDLEAEFRALGRPFEKLADMYGGEEEDSDVETTTEDDGAILV